MNLLDDVRHTINRHQMLQKEDTVLCAVSGGADSMCLLHLMTRLQSEMHLRIACAHVHHGIRKAADGDAAFVQAYCQEKDIPFYLRKVNAKALFAKDTHLSLEEAARCARYEALRDMAKEARANKIATAHNADDQAETVLFHLLRGTGIKGLTGIPAVRDDLVRPLLFTERADIAAYLAAQKIPFVTDETNADTAYTRNAIRHLLMPLAQKEVNLRAGSHIAQTAADMTELLAFYEEETYKAFQRCKKDGDAGEEGGTPGEEVTEVTLSVKALRAEQPLFRDAVLKYALSQIAGEKDLTRRQIDALARIVLSDNGKATLDLSHGRRAERLHDHLTLLQQDGKPQDG